MNEQNGFRERHSKIALEIGDPVGEEKGNQNLASLGDSRKAIEYHEKRLEIAMEVGDRVAKGNAYGSLGNAYQSQSDF